MTAARFLGRYELLEALGEGGMGAVWLARLSGTAGFEKLCIVKTVLPAIAKDPQFVSRFTHEGRVLTQLQHSNIAQVLDMGEAEGSLYIALEYVPGLDVSKLQRASSGAGQRLPIEVSTFIIQQAAEGLGFAHRKTLPDGTALNIVHRDVSPQNIMVSWDGEVKVIDFGIARSEARSHSTAQASVMGKLGYMAPEQARGEALDHRADQYALGVMLWELLANQPLVPRGTVTEMVVAMAHPKVRPLVPLMPEVPADLEAVVLKALSADPANRYETTDDFARALMDSLARRAGIPTRRQIGDFVKQWGQTQFAEQQALLTRISTIRTPRPASTVVTPGATAPMPQASAAEPTMNTAELQKAVKRGNGGVVVAVLLGFVIVGFAAVKVLRSSIPPSELNPQNAVSPAPVKPEPLPQMLVQVEQSADVMLDGDKVFARVGSNAGVRVGQTLRVIGPETPAGRVLLGEAVVVEVTPELAKVVLNGPASQATGPRFVLLKEKGLPAVVSAPVAAKPVEVAKPATEAPKGTTEAVKATPAAARMSASLKLQRAPRWQISVTNTSNFTWANCSVFIPGQRKWVLKSLSPTFIIDMPLNYFQPDPAAPVLNDEVEIRCAQGSVRLPARE